MTTKKIGELTYADLGKQVTLNEPDGDRISGELTSIRFSKFRSAVTIGNNGNTVQPDWEIEIQTD